MTELTEERVREIAIEEIDKIENGKLARWLWAMKELGGPSPTPDQGEGFEILGQRKR